MTQHRPSLTGRIAALARAGLVVGIVVAALVYPLAALGGLGVKSGAAMLAGPLEQLTIVPPAQTTHIYAADATTLITQFYEEYRTYTPIAATSPHIQQAIVAAEDARFYDHHGVDLKGIIRAFVANQQAGEVSQGASTLTMQYVRNVLRDSAQTPAEVQAATEQTGARKLREIKLAIQLERRLTKTEILERYLNVAYFGHRAYGIHAAAEVYFSKRPAELTLPEAATLAGLVQAPSAYDPAGDPAAAVERRNYVIDRMVGLGYVTSVDAAQAGQQPIGLHLTDPANDCVSIPVEHNDWGFFCDLFKSWWTNQPAFGASPAERLDRLRRGGYTVVTSLDPGVQASAQRHILAKEKNASSFALGMVAVEPGTGRIRAMAVNRMYSLDQSRNGPHPDKALRRAIRGSYPNTVNPLLGGGDLPGYQAGSTFKLFTLLTALEQGMPLSTAIYAPQRYQSIYRTEPNNPASCAGNHWCPQNASASMTGRQTIWSGFGKSVNTFFVQLEQRVGAQNAVRMAERLGLTWHTDVDRLQATPEKARTWGAFTLGVADTTPLEMAGAYATVAADGVYCDPLPVLSITGLDGKPAMTKPASTEAASTGAAEAVPVATPHCRQAVSPAVARGAIDAARCVTGYGAAAGGCGGWSTGPRAYRIVGRPIAGKTGTTDDNRSAWFIGITPGLTVAGFIADPDYPFHSVGGKANHDKPIQSVTETMHDALTGTPVLYFTPPPAEIVGGQGRRTKLATRR